MAGWRCADADGGNPQLCGCGLRCCRCLCFLGADFRVRAGVRQRAPSAEVTGASLEFCAVGGFVHQVPGTAEHGASGAHGVFAKVNVACPGIFRVDESAVADALPEPEFDGVFVQSDLVSVIVTVSRVRCLVIAGFDVCDTEGAVGVAVDTVNETDRGNTCGVVSANAGGEICDDLLLGGEHVDLCGVLGTEDAFDKRPECAFPCKPVRGFFVAPLFYCRFREKGSCSVEGAFACGAFVEPVEKDTVNTRSYFAWAERVRGLGQET